MAGVLASKDIAVTSIGYPIRNMHTISEIGSTQDILAATYATKYVIEEMNKMNNGKGMTVSIFNTCFYNIGDLKTSHPRLDLAIPLMAQDIPFEPSKKDN